MMNAALNLARAYALVMGAAFLFGQALPGTSLLQQPLREYLAYSQRMLFTTIVNSTSQEATTRGFWLLRL